MTNSLYLDSCRGIRLMRIIPPMTAQSHRRKVRTNLQAQALEQTVGVRKNLGRRSPVKSEKRRAGLFKPGQSGNPNGRVPGTPNAITKYKVDLFQRTGMMPLDFLFAVFRDELYDDYDVQASTDGRQKLFTPKRNTKGDICAKKLMVTLEQRLSAASTAAPYVHRKMPVGIEGTPGKPIALIHAESLKKLDDKQLDSLMNLLAMLGIPEQFEGHGPITFDENGKQVSEDS